MRYRLTFSKTGSLRYIGHLDLQAVWERTARRAGLSLAYTHGFHPGPRIQIASALPLGFAGYAELVDLWLDPAPPDLAEAQKDLQAAAPPGLTILHGQEVDDKAPALQTQVLSTEYCVELLEPCSILDLQQDVENLLAAPSLPRQRRDKAYDLRPLIESLAVTTDGCSPLDPQTSAALGLKLFMCLAARPGATGRPEEVLAALGIPFESTRIERTRLVLQG